jgi:hypothetical protein
MNITKRSIGAFRSFILAAFAIAILAIVAPPAKAQNTATGVGEVKVISAGTLTNAATWSPSTIVNVDLQSMIGLSVRFQGDGSDTANVITKVFRSSDGVNFETSPPATLFFTNALNNTTAVVGYHQISRDLVGSARAVKITVQNVASTVKGTNATIAIVKKREPGS